MRGLTSLVVKNMETVILRKGKTLREEVKTQRGVATQREGVKNQMEGGKNSADRRLWVNLNTYVITAVVS